MKQTYQFLTKIPLFLAAMLLWGHTIAQPVTVTGKVFDSTNKSSIPGVAIIIKGSTVGTVSDMDGNFSLQANKGAVLEFSFMGYMKEEVTVGDQTVYNVGLVPDIEMLSEVVVIGYGTQKKSDRTGSVAHVTSEELSGGVLTDPIQAMVGKAAGVSITKRGGDPNGGFSVKIRGSSGLYSGTEPLYVIDGVPGADPTTVSPDDIDSYNILKDASSTAIYGSRGSNGVIIITTKKGTKGGSSIEYSNYFAIDNVLNRLDLMSADEYRALIAKYPDRYTNVIDNGANTDWQDEIYRVGYSQNHNISGTGSFEKNSYRFSISHNDLEGVVRGSTKKRTIGRFNTIAYGMDNRLKLDGTISATFEKNNYIMYDGNGGKDVLYQAFQRNPTDPVYDSTGGYFQIQRDFNYNNPVALIDKIQNERDAKRLMGNIKGDLELIEGLVASLSLSYNRDDEEAFYFEPKDLLSSISEGYSRRGYGNKDSKILETTFSYTNTFLDLHNISSVLGYSYQRDVYDGFFAQGKNPFSSLLQSNNLGSLLSVLPGQDIGSYKNSNKIISFFGRVIYNFNSKYFATVSLRRDGSTKFGKNNEWGLFPTGSLAWNIKDEAFLTDFQPISLLKMRLGYGIVGNQEIASYLDIISSAPVTVGTDPETTLPTVIFGTGHNANPNLKWEENKELNIGLDFGVLNNRISGSFEFYDKTTYDILAPYSVPVPPNFYDRTWANVGTLTNRGIELQIQAFVVDHTNFKWKTTYTFSRNKQKMKELSNDYYSWDSLRTGYLSGRGLVGSENWTQLIVPGFELGTFYLPVFAGIQTDGAFLFYTASGGVTRNVEEAERKIVGSAQPKFEMGWSNFFTIYKNIDASFSMRLVYGFDIFNLTRMVFENPQTVGTLNGLRSVEDAINSGLTDAPKISDYYLEDGTFLRLDYLSVGYNFDLTKFKWLKKARAYVATNNLFTITGYTGIDPEITYNGLNGIGIDKYNVYPKTRTITAGINVTF